MKRFVMLGIVVAMALAVPAIGFGQVAVDEDFDDFNISVTPDSHVAWIDDVLVIPLIFGNSFESGDLSGWSSATQ